MKFAADVRAPPASVVPYDVSRLLLQVLQKLSPAATMTSWWRSAERNRAVGGVANSLHVRGLAFDFRLDAAGQQMFDGWRRLGLQAFRESDHFHLELQQL